MTHGFSHRARTLGGMGGAGDTPSRSKWIIEDQHVFHPGRGPPVLPALAFCGGTREALPVCPPVALKGRKMPTRPAGARLPEGVSAPRHPRQGVKTTGQLLDPVGIVSEPGVEQGVWRPRG